MQLHFFQGEEAAPSGYHIGIEVDDFEAAYERVEEHGARIGEGYFSYLYELPDGAVQMHLRDPAGNMVEVNWPDASTLDRSVVAEEIHKVAAETEEKVSHKLFVRDLVLHPDVRILVGSYISLPVCGDVSCSGDGVRAALREAHAHPLFPLGGGSDYDERLEDVFRNSLLSLR